MHRVTADSNIYISALNFGGKPLQVLELARAGEIELAISNAIITETSRILHHKFHWKREDVIDAVEQILSFTQYVHTDYTLDVVPTDPDDNRRSATTRQSRTLGSGVLAMNPWYRHGVM